MFITGPLTFALDLITCTFNTLTFYEIILMLIVQYVYQPLQESNQFVNLVLQFFLYFCDFHKILLQSKTKLLIKE